MSKALFVRGFDEMLHTKLEEISKKKGIQAALILEDAFKKWLDEQKDLPKKHFAVLYSDKESLMNFMLKVKESLGDEWMHTCFGPPTHFAIKFLKEHGWQDVSIQPFSQVNKKTLNYSKRMFALRAKAAKKKPIASMGFITEHVTQTNSLKTANLIEKSYNDQRSAGIAFCLYDSTDLNGSTLDYIMEMFALHDKVLIVKKDNVFELDVNKTNLLKVLL